MSFYRGLFAVVVMLGVAIVSTGAFAAVPLTLTHQGRLLDATDKPVNGFFDITYRVFEVPSGGAPLWTEVHASVQVADGLFSALLGSTVPLSADVFGGGGSGGALAPPRYLEVTVGGVALTPRLALSSVPSALSASRVTGDIETSPGLVVMGDSLTDNYATFGEKVNQGLHAAGGALASGKTLITFGCDGTSASQVMEKKGLNAVNVKLARTISSPPGGLLALDALDMDSDDDGVMDKSVSSSCDATGARLNVTNLGSSGQDGVSLSALPTTSGVAIKTKGTGADANKTAACSAIGSIPIVGGVLASLGCTVDDDGDGVPETSVSSSCDVTSAYHAVKTKGTGANSGRTASVASSTDESTASSACTLDLDGDGLADKSVSSSCDTTGARLNVTNLGSSGQDGVSLSALPTGSSVAIKEKGTGADPRRSITSTVNPEAASTVLAADLDGDGVMDVTSADSVDATGASRKLVSHNLGSSGQDGVEISSRPSGASFRAIATKGTGATLRCTGSADAVAAKVLLEADTNGDGVPESSLRESSAPSVSEIVLAADVNGDGVPESSLRESSAPSVSEIVVTKLTVDRCKLSTNTGLTVKDGSSATVCSADTAGNGYFSGTLAIGVLPASHHIDVAGGAYCDGTNWVNASDRNSKENFTAVDGNELLNQIAQLSITRWNYKGNNQAEHIGPTAQDFKAAFGVGADDKSISTIDPSGIALAAIKALNNKMQELNAKTSQLEDQAREITQLKAELDAIKAILQKQADTKN